MSTKQQCPDDLDLTALEDWSRPFERLRCELVGIRMLANDLTAAQKFHTTLVFLFWMAWTVALGRGWLDLPEGLETVTIFAYGFLTLLVGAIVARAHELELEKLVALADEGITITVGGNDDEED
ncbi:hypothetical protein C482_15266 [Natrialba chahannaoensis JCM 10990]|uniref:Uncharacterized protein n=1 Tax=Natrialba chahannaoensis JCM 10990 TaxID=1227492 RepID=M0AEB5_9EURY|nr:hypothetical protein [Natrialba chahannaoensis]ELY96746.1 hypothetical protein C482_15266 [Natrialba chahannaoensis JCM 10990]